MVFVPLQQKRGACWSLLRGAVLGGIGLAFSPILSRAATGDTVVLSTFGGALDQALRDAYLDPFTKATGTKVDLTSNASLATLKLQVQSGRPQIDAMVVVGADYDAAVNQNLLEPVRYTRANQMLPAMTKSHGFANGSCSKHAASSNVPRFMTCAIIRRSLNAASSGDVHHTYLRANSRKSGCRERADVDISLLYHRSRRRPIILTTHPRYQ